MPGSPATPRGGLNGLLSPRGTPRAGKPVRRASSFDRFSRRSSKAGADAEAAPPTQTISKQLLFILLSRGPKGAAPTMHATRARRAPATHHDVRHAAGLGLELDATNTIVTIVPGGAADVQGYFRVGDTVASVDGVPLRGRLLQARERSLPATSCHTQTPALDC